MVKFLLFVSTVILFCSIQILSQSGKIAGKVTDAASGQPLPFINVVVVGTNYGAASDVDGNYNVIGVPPGTYTVRASAIGYTPVVVEGVKVSIDLTSTVDFKLSETSVQIGKEIVVVAEKPLVQKDLTSSTAIVNASDIKSLPITSFQDVLQLQAGVIKDNNGNFHFRGGRSGEVSYWIDGVPVTDAYDGSTVVDVNKNSIQEMQLVTGAFNAEYGQAMSGIVNIATKTGGNETHATITAYKGAYITANSDVFYGTQKWVPFTKGNQNQIQWLEGSVDGPIIKDKLFYYADLRYYYTGGYLFGQRKYNVWDIANTNAASSTNWTIQQTGDNSIVSMAPYMEGYAQGKLTYKILPGLSVSYDYILDNTRGKDYDFTYKYDPDGELSNFKKGYLNSLTITHALGNSTFYTLGVSYFYRDYREYLDTSAFSLSDLFQRQDPFNQDYVNNKILTAPEATFYTGGTNMSHNVQNISTYVGKFDITSQVSDHHEIKAGVLYERYRLYLHNINLQMSDADNNNDPVLSGNPFLIDPVVIPSDETQNNLEYLHKPWQFSAYVQDKMEYQSLIVNLGVRFDYFHPDGQVLADPSDPNVYIPLNPIHQAESLDQRLATWYKNASDKWQLSPRLGVSFPITDRGVIHFSYGIFFQIPDFERLYENPGYKLAVTGGSTDLGIIGNPDLKPEQTTSGELGVQQQLTDDIAIDITGYFRDIRNLAGTLNQIQYVFGGTKIYSEYVNTDFGFVRGLVLSVNKRFSEGISASLDYTFQIAKGDASDPASAYNLRNSGVQPETELIPLDWDQRHTLNLSLNYVNPSGWGASAVFRYGSGTPYTVTNQTVANIGTLTYNSQDKPSTTNVDFQCYKDFDISVATLSIFMRINNLLDTKNPITVFTDTGQPDWSLDEQQQLRINAPRLVSSVQDWYTRPGYYSEPRRVELGATISF
jgi:outer membrane receptor protein involved in Fe transport